MRRFGVLAIFWVLACLPVAAEAQDLRDFIRKFERDFNSRPAPPGPAKPWIDPDGGQGQSQRPAPAGPAYAPPLVRETQQRLNDLGYDAGPADGQMGPRTRSAIRAFEQDQGAPPTGAPSVDLVERLRAAAPVAVASSGLGAPRPSFDCAAATTESERAICGSHRLAALDRELGRVYGAALSEAAGVDRAAQIQDQKRWNEDAREACGADEACLEAVIGERLADFGGDPETALAQAEAAEAAAAESAGAVAIPEDQAYEYLQDRYMALHPEDVAADGFLSGFAAQRCHRDRARYKEAADAAANEFARHAYVEKVRAELRDAAARAARAPSVGLFTVDFDITFDEYDFGGEKFPISRVRGAEVEYSYRKGTCPTVPGLDGSGDFPKRFAIVDTAGRPLSAQGVSQMIGGAVAMPPSKAQEYVSRYGRAAILRATFEVGAPARLADSNSTEASMAQARVVSVSVVAKRGFQNKGAFGVVIGPDQIVNPDPGAVDDEVAELSAELLLTHYLKRFPGLIEDDPLIAASWLYLTENGECSQEAAALQNARATNEFAYRDLLAAAHEKARARFASLSEPPSRIVIRQQADFGGFSEERMAFPLVRGGAEEKRPLAFSDYENHRTCAPEGRGLPSRFSFEAPNAYPAYELPFESPEEARRFYEESGLDRARKNLQLEYVVDLKPETLALGQNGVVGAAVVVEARLIDADNGGTLWRFGPELFTQATEALAAAAEAEPEEDAAPALNYRDLLLGYLSTTPALLSDDGVVRAYLDASDCSWRREVQGNEIRHGAKIRATRAALQAVLAEDRSDTVGDYEVLLRTQLGDYDLTRQLFPYAADAVRVTTGVPICGGHRGDHGRAPQTFEIIVTNYDQVLDKGLPMSVAEADAFLEERSGDRSVQFTSVIRVAKPQPKDDRTASALAVALNATVSDTRRDPKALFDYGALEATQEVDVAAMEVAGLRLGAAASDAPAALVEIAPVAYAAHFAPPAGDATAIMGYQSLYLLESQDRVVIHRAGAALDGPIFGIVRRIVLPPSADLMKIGALLEQTYGAPTQSQPGASQARWTWKGAATPNECVLGFDVLRGAGDLVSESGAAPALSVGAANPSVEQRRAELRRTAYALGGRALSRLETLRCGPVLDVTGRRASDAAEIIVSLYDPGEIQKALFAASERPAEPEAPAPAVEETIKF